MSLIRFGRGREYQFLRREDLRMRWDVQSAAQFLNGFRKDAAAMAGLRRQAQATGKVTDEQVVQIIARQLVSGEFVVALPQRQRQMDHLEVETPTAVPAPRQARAAERAADEPTFESNHDGAAQAAVLIAAAAGGFPFCEECARHAAMQAGRA